MKIRYSTNNSGGDYWLKKKDWAALRKAGWTVEPLPKNQIGDLLSRLGCTYHNAHKNFRTVRAALLEFEKLTGQKVSDEGCPCCGPPHSFSWKNGYCSGEDCLKYLYNHVPKSLRDACK